MNWYKLKTVILGPREVVQDRVREQVLEKVREDPHTSTRVVANEVMADHVTVHRVLKNNRFHPWKATTVQELSDEDKIRRFNFCEWFIRMCIQQPDLFPRFLCFSDECTFYEDGSFNRHNNHFWAVENPHWTRVTHRQRRWSVNVWAAVVGDYTIGPIFIEGNVNGATYLEFIEQQLDALLQVVPEEERDNIIFQQDGHPAHRTNLVKEALNAKFAGRWIGLGSELQEYPPRSPDLTICDNFLWGYVKEKVYEEPRAQNAEQLKIKITQAFATITPGMLREVRRNLKRRVDLCAGQNGGHFENLL